MKKIKKSADEILKLIVAKLREDDRFSDVTPLEPHLHEIDADGCNWDLEYWTGSKEEAIAAKQHIFNYVRSLRNQFDLEGKS